jgi:hypothetical protein
MDETQRAIKPDFNVTFFIAVHADQCISYWGVDLPLASSDE